MSEAIKKGLRVVRGKDWKWDDQDGGEGNVGTVILVIGEANNIRSGQLVNVLWDCGFSGNYRTGHEDKYDLRVFDSAPAGVQHKSINCSECQMKNLHGIRWKCGVCENCDLCSTCYMTDKHDVNHEFKRIDTFGSARCFSVKARAYSKKVTAKGTFIGAKVERGLSWNYNDQDGGPHSAGEVIKIINAPNDESWDSYIKVKWNNKSINDYKRGHEGEVDVRCLTAADGGTYYVDHLPLLGYTPPTPSFKAVDLVLEASEGNITHVQKILKQFPGKVNILEKQGDRTALMVAAYNGHSEVVSELLTAGADIALADDEGDTALHYAVFSNKVNIIEQLMRSSTAAVNSKNDSGHSALHMAVNKQHIECVRKLLKYDSDVNSQNNNGDTPLDDAVCNSDDYMVDLLVNSNKVDFKLKNNQGINVLHRAALYQDSRSMSKFIQKAPKLVNVPMVDGKTPLHLAASAGDVQTATVLIDEGRANLEMTASDGSTALILAVLDERAPTIELLVTKGANLKAEDDAGDTALHVATLFLRRHQEHKQILDDLDKAPGIYKIFTPLNPDQLESSRAWLAVACFLLQHGADMNQKNHSSKSPMDYIEDSNHRRLLQKHSRTSRKS